MDRRMRYAVASCGLGLSLLIAGTGCRNLRAPEVPPDPGYYPQGAATTAPPVGFSSEPASVNPYGGAMTGAAPDASGYAADPAQGGAMAPGSYGNYGGSAYPATVAPPAAASVPEPEPLQTLPDLSAPGATPGGM